MRYAEHGIIQRFCACDSAFLIVYINDHNNLSLLPAFPASTPALIIHLLDCDESISRPGNGSPEENDIPLLIYSNNLDISNRNPAVAHPSRKLPSLVRPRGRAGTPHGSRPTVTFITMCFISTGKAPAFYSAGKTSSFGMTADLHRVARFETCLQ